MVFWKFLWEGQHCDGGDKVVIGIPSSPSREDPGSYVLRGIKNLTKIVRFSSKVEFKLSGDIFIRKVSQNQGKQKNV